MPRIVMLGKLDLKPMNGIARDSKFGFLRKFESKHQVM